VSREFIPTANEVDGCTSFRAGLGQEKRAVGEIERRQTTSFRRLRAGLSPLQSPRDHEVDHHEEFTVKREDHPFAEPTDIQDASTCNLIGRRGDRAKHKGVGHPEPLQSRSGDQPVQTLDIDRDIRQFGHGTMVPAPGK
jgi:hypothetical protein